LRARVIQAALDVIVLASRQGAIGSAAVFPALLHAHFHTFTFDAARTRLRVRLRFTFNVGVCACCTYTKPRAVFISALLFIDFVADTVNATRPGFRLFSTGSGQLTENTIASIDSTQLIAIGLRGVLASIVWKTTPP